MIFGKKKNNKPTEKPKSRFIDSDRFPVQKALQSAGDIDFDFEKTESLIPDPAQLLQNRIEQPEAMNLLDSLELDTPVEKSEPEDSEEDRYFIASKPISMGDLVTSKTDIPDLNETISASSNNADVIQPCLSTISEEDLETCMKLALKAEMPSLSTSIEQVTSIEYEEKAPEPIPYIAEPIFAEQKTLQEIKAESSFEGELILPPSLRQETSGETAFKSFIRSMLAEAKNEDAWQVVKPTNEISIDIPQVEDIPVFISKEPMPVQQVLCETEEQETYSVSNDISLAQEPVNVKSNIQQAYEVCISKPLKQQDICEQDLKQDNIPVAVNQRKAEHKENCNKVWLYDDFGAVKPVSHKKTSSSVKKISLFETSPASSQLPAVLMQTQSTSEYIDHNAAYTEEYLKSHAATQPLVEVEETLLSEEVEIIPAIEECSVENFDYNHQFKAYDWENDTQIVELEQETESQQITQCHIEDNNILPEENADFAFSQELSILEEPVIIEDFSDFKLEDEEFTFPSFSIEDNDNDIKPVDTADSADLEIDSLSKDTDSITITTNHATDSSDNVNSEENLIDILASAPLIEPFQIMIIHHETTYALMVDDGKQSIMLKSFGSDNPMESDSRFIVTQEAVLGIKSIFVVNVGTWQGLVAVEGAQVVLQAEI